LEKAQNIVLKFYKTTKKFPRDELYGLTSQIRIVAISIPTNISEGCVRSSDADFARFLYIALGSTSELEYLTVLSSELKYIEKSSSVNLLEEINEVKKMLISLIKKLKAY
jgi:four helix bundle protein